VAAKIAPSQIPALGQYTMAGLIRHIYGEDCKFLIEQFGLVTTFNRALQKFAEQYASTLVVETAAEEKRPVTRDVELPSQKPTEEAEPAPVLPLTPPEASASRVANDPRERRRLAKLAAEQAKEEHLASNIAPAAPVVESTETTQEVQETAIEAVVAENTVGDAAPEQQALALANEEMPVVVEETAPAEAVESAQAAVKTETAVVTEAVEAVQTVENTEPVASTEETDVEDEAAKAEKEKSTRPRRPRGRPPKKSIVGNE
jgi:ribonuclease E